MHGVIVQTEKGDILGHEFCGVVESVGPAVKNIRPGERVVNSFCISCGECQYCKQKLTTACEKTNASRLHEKMYGGRMSGIFGYSHFTGGYAGGQAEYVRVPLADNNLLKIPDSVPDEKGLYLSDVLPTSYHAVTYTGVKEGDTVAIWGLGPIGFMACFWALKVKGARRVIGIDNNWRTKYTMDKIPGVETINYTELQGKTVPDRVHEMVPGGVDIAIDATGGEYGKGWTHKVELALNLEQDTSEMINECIYSVKKFGKVGVIGDYVGCEHFLSLLPLAVQVTDLNPVTNHFNIGAVMELGITLVGCGQAPVQRCKSSFNTGFGKSEPILTVATDWEELRDFIVNGTVDPTIMLTHRFKIDDVAKGYYMQEKRQDGLVKCFVETRFSAPRAPGTPELTTL